jgi:hypothetical protein
MASVAQLGYLGLDVSSLANWESFATEVLGLQVAAKTPDGALCLRADENHHRFILQQGSRDDVAFLGWEVADQNSRRNCAPTASRSLKPPRTTLGRAEWSN